VENIAELFTAVIWRVEVVNTELEYLSGEISKQPG
jgi:hypothetical protein